MPEDLRPAWAKEMATRRERKAYLHSNWKKACASLHEAKPGDGVYIKGRFRVYAGLGQDDAGEIRHRWVNWCCDCGERFYSYSVTPEAAIGGDRANPRWVGGHRCATHRDAGRPTPDGFAPAVFARFWATQNWRYDGRDGPPINPNLVSHPEDHYRFLAGHAELLTDAEKSEHRRLTILTSLL